ncbi:LysE/ArgO family amino acid transporter [Agrobacterium tumefaciens]|uniref:LysE/ArgO family amino acid transporter n=1 Tax=Agrobacterium tumefaciens TaxID=358 RepID=UPI0021D01D67|nr:LysE family transporter [Agrobacterium tumefaciens]UXS01878.1 LysE family transporter [Agrobacterium tumefaciens]
MSSFVHSLFLEGLLLGVALFSAPGPKDTLVIRQGVSGGAIWGVVAICVIADAILIAIGVSGVGTLLESHPRIVAVLLLSGALYLVWFGGQRLVACIRNQSMPRLADTDTGTQRHLLRTAFILSFANPYAWLDTVVLIGSMGAAKPVDQQSAFSAGTMVASFIWFVLLAAGSKKLTGLFQSPQAWRMLDAGIALLMAYLTFGLVQDFMRLL